MIFQGTTGQNQALEAPVSLTDHQVDPATAPVPRVARGGSAAMLARLQAYQTGPHPFILAAEQVGTALVKLPRVAARQRAAVLAFAVEELIAAPVDQTLVAQGPVIAEPGAPQLVFVVDRKVVAACPAEAQRVLPEILLIPRPSTPGWAVWQDGDRCLVRADDGTGFAAATPMLPLLWARAGRPEINLLGGALPGDMPHRDLTAGPPPPDAGELAYGLPQIRPGDAARAWRPVMIAGAMLALGLVAHLAVRVTDVIALGRIAQTEQAAAQAVVSDVMPGLTVTADVGPILSRLAPAAAAPQGSALLPLLADASSALVEIDPEVTFRRLAWGAAENELVILVQATGLEALQAIETGLTSRGFVVRQGAASAEDGGAEAELRIGRAPS